MLRWCLFLRKYVLVWLSTILLFAFSKSRWWWRSPSVNFKARLARGWAGASCRRLSVCVWFCGPSWLCSFLDFCCWVAACCLDCRCRASGCVSWVLVGCGHVVIGTSPCVAVSVPLPLPWFCRFVKVWSSSALCWFSWLICVVVYMSGTSSSRSSLTVQSLLLILWYRTKMVSIASIVNMLFSFVPVRRWVVGVMLVGLTGLCCRDAVWYMLVYRLVLSSSSCFAWCQIACNMARASLSCPIFAVTTSSIYPLTLGVCRWFVNNTRSGSSGCRLPFSSLFLVIISVIWLFCRWRSATSRCPSPGGCGTSRIHVFVDASSFPWRAGCVSTVSRSGSFLTLLWTWKRRVVGSAVQRICVPCPVSDSCCKTSWRHFLIFASVVSGGKNPVAPARVDLSASSSRSLRVVRFVCSSFSSLCSLHGRETCRFSRPWKSMEDRICYISWSFVLFVCASIVFCVIFCLRVERGSQLDSYSFKEFLNDWVNRSRRRIESCMLRSSRRCLSAYAKPCCVVGIRVLFSIFCLSWRIVVWVLGLIVIVSAVVVVTKTWLCSCAESCWRLWTGRNCGAWKNLQPPLRGRRAAQSRWDRNLWASRAPPNRRDCSRLWDRDCWCFGAWDIRSSRDFQECRIYSVLREATHVTKRENRSNSGHVLSNDP